MSFPASQAALPGPPETNERNRALRSEVSAVNEAETAENLQSTHSDSATVSDDSHLDEDDQASLPEFASSDPLGDEEIDNLNTLIQGQGNSVLSSPVTPRKTRRGTPPGPSSSLSDATVPAAAATIPIACQSTTEAGTANFAPCLHPTVVHRTPSLLEKYVNNDTVKAAVEFLKKDITRSMIEAMPVVEQKTLNPARKLESRVARNIYLQRLFATMGKQHAVTLLYDLKSFMKTSQNFFNEEEPQRVNKFFNYELFASTYLAQLTRLSSDVPVTTIPNIFIDAFVRAVKYWE